MQNNHNITTTQNKNYYFSRINNLFLINYVLSGELFEKKKRKEIVDTITAIDHILRYIEVSMYTQTR